MRETRVKLHPITGLPIVPVGYVGNRPVWPILGAAEDGDDTGGGGSDDDDDAGGSSNDGDGDDDDGDDDDSSDETPKDNDGLKSALEKERQAKKDLKRELRKANEAIQQAERAKLDDKERAEKERDDALAAVEKAEERLQDQAVKIAFLSNDKYKWHNPERAMKLLDLDDVDFDDDGDVTGIEEAIEKLAKSDPYLIKSESDDDDDDDKGKKNGTSSGGPVGSKKKNKDDRALDRSSLEKTYPALRK